MTHCPACTGEAVAFADGMILGHRTVSYLCCRDCASVFLPEPDWLDEAYSSAISSLDVGLLERCLQLANISTALIGSLGLRGGSFLDFAGGYGTLTRLMRDRGFGFQHLDPLCNNIFADGFEARLNQRYQLITAFEVLEHLDDPVRTLNPVAEASDFMLVTTQVLPEPAPRPDSWDYYAPETGQHITFYTVAGLRALAGRLGYQLTSSGRLVHLFHRKPLGIRTRMLLRDERFAYLLGALRSEVGRRHGLTAEDRAEVVARFGRLPEDR